MVQTNRDRTNFKRILLMLLPYWTPLIPPMGITSLKSFLEQKGFQVKTVDANAEMLFKQHYDKYFNLLREYIPADHWGNFFNIGHDVLRNQMMAHLNYSDEEEYASLTKTLVFETFYHELTRPQVDSLIEIMADFYQKLHGYVLRLLEEEKPDVLGLTACLGTLPACLYTFKLAKEKEPRLKTIMGGTAFAGQIPVGSPDYELFLSRTPYIDHIIFGEGESLLLKLLRGELPEKRLYTEADLHGEQLDISAKPLPDFSDLEVDFYPYLGATGSKSCLYQCSFCNVVGFFGEYRQKTVKQTVAEMKVLYKKYHYQLFFMTDSLLNPIITDFANEIINHNQSMYWDGYLRVGEEVEDIENTLLWRRGGFYRARLGVESGSQRILDLMGKKITVEQTKKALAALAFAGIKTTAYFVIGHPGETEADFQQTLSLLEELKNDIWEAECNPFYYYYNGQPKSDEWEDKRVLLYPESATNMLLTQTWILDCEPSRKETFYRIFRFAEQCAKLGIPNPYSRNEIYKADERWRKLHKNAVPSLLEFSNKNKYIDENLKIRRLSPAYSISLQDGDFGF
ncbi:MAG TPA: radical SAM protein [Bacillota bacterium]|nr:radical SAM protein [Bacillota bacterium]